MAPRAEVKIAPPDDSYPKCDICGWWDRKLRSVSLNVTPEERILIHKWARHDGNPLPPEWSKQPQE